MDCKQIQDIQSTHFREALAIYENSFPSNERQSNAKITKRIKEEKSQLFVGIYNKEVIAMALLWDFTDSPFALLDYLAVADAYRSHNFGTVLFQFLVEKATRNHKFLIIEVERYQTEQHNEQRKKRINFYLKNGAYLMDEVPYVLPSLDATEPTEMHLMIAPKYPQKYLERITITNLIQRLYLEVYEKEPNDALLVSLLKKLPFTINLKNTLLK